MYKFIFKILMMLTILSGSLTAQEMPVPVKLQASLFKKIFLYDRTLQNKDKVEVLIVYSSAKYSVKTGELFNAFKKINISINTVEESMLRDKIETVSVVYLAPGVLPSAVKQVCSEKGILSISGFPSFTKNGDVSISLDTKANGQPQIIVNMTRIKAEGHELSAELLKLAKLVQ